jgi:hypothetical protein
MRSIAREWKQDIAYELGNFLSMNKQRNPQFQYFKDKSEHKTSPPLSLIYHN